MDVTSLLNANANANSIAAEQQKKEEATRIPSRNRTPWDAGGYALPINTLSSGPSTPPRQQAYHHESQMETTPTSPRHRFSDSRSSLSSFTSSLQSATHSRFSSMSTVNSIHSLNSLAEALSPKSGTKPETTLDFGSISISIEGVRPAANETQQRGSLSPTLSLDALALVAESRLVGQQNAARPQPLETSNMSREIEKGKGDAFGRQERPSSPSDAILIKRSAVPILRVNTGDHELQPVNLATANRNYLSAPLETHYNSLLHPKQHKRALSAPEFTGVIGNYNMSDTSKSPPPRTVPMAEPTPPTSHHPDNASPTNIMSYPTPDTTPAAAADGEAKSVVCMYISKCDTNSQLRKAISHIFGRNKMCTRLIPQHVWVHYCRKHYQRSRYRNPKEYAKLQCDLVQQQIRRVHEWSLNNTEQGAAGVVQDWGLAVRKREQKRLDEISAAKRKRSAAAAFDQDSDDEMMDDDDARGGLHIPPTAVPEWLLALCGKGYTTQEILRIFNRLHTEILEDTMPCFPDIEILPNIVVDQDQPKSPKGYSKRAASTGHKRAQSLGVTMKPDYYSASPDRRRSQPAIRGHEGSSYGSPIEKRRRPNETGETSLQERPVAQFHRSRLTERPNDGGRRMLQQPSHRPVFADINEHQSQEAGDYYAYSPQLYQPPLPAPTPQRMTGQSMAAHLETHNEHLQSARRPVHQRSQSDMSGFERGRNDYSSPSSSTYVDYPNRPSPFHEQNPGHAYNSSQHRWEPAAQASQSKTVRGVVSQLPGLGHSRNHSAQPSYATQYVQGGRPQETPQPHMSSSHGQNAFQPRVREHPHVREFYANAARR